ncbi:MAG: DNA methyltransferase [candidate division KSB1 bacterium]|nr:DNA methyltransferase [candidate division KSB1 bacterium]MDZ7367731.1 DNA methyltransferase [candidate division KSB1 bacterium]MDZ7406303.1 DNA methyltransferase [candidate division KSB1 bacterium]
MKRAIEEYFPIIEINRLAVPERNAFKPIYQMHKWFARRSSSVFRAILLGALKPAGTDIMEEFYKDHTNDPDTKGKVILDPFMGGGTTVVEALRLGCKVIGVDLNPVAWFIVKTEVEPVDIEELKKAFERLAQRRVEWSGKPLKQTLLDLYKTECPACGNKDADIIYTFWVKSAPCTTATCNTYTPLFSDYFIAQKNPSIRYFPDCVCSACKQKFDWEREPAALVGEPKLMVNATNFSAGEGRTSTRWAFSNSSSVQCPWCHKTVSPSQEKFGKLVRKKVLLTVLLCPQCEEVWQFRGPLPEEVECPTCKHQYNPNEGNVPEKGKFICRGTCNGNKDTIIAAIRKLPENQLLPTRPYAIEGYCERCAAPSRKSKTRNLEQTGLFEDEGLTASADSAIPHPQSAIGNALLTKNNGKFFKRMTPADSQRYQDASDKWQNVKANLPYPKSEIPDGVETHRLIEHHYRYWHQMFNDRQLLALSTLLKAIDEEREQRMKEMLVSGFYGALEGNNTFCRYTIKGGNKSQGIFSRHDFQPKLTFTENAVWGTEYGHGTFSNKFDLVVEGKKFCSEPYDRKLVAAESKEKFESIQSKEKICPSDIDTILVSQSSADCSFVHSQEIDFVITDPPYSSNVNYSELADFFYVWLRLSLKKQYSQFVPEITPKAEEIIENRTRGKSAQDFKAGLESVFKETRRFLVDDGLLVFTFHHSEGSAWEALLTAVCDAGYFVEAVYPIHGEAESSLHLQEKEAISYDLIHVCRKMPENSNPTKRSWAGIRHEIRQKAREEAQLIQAGRYGREPLSAADRNILLIGKCLELYSKHYGAIVDHEDKPVPIHRALEEIKMLVDQIVTKDHPLPPELSDIDVPSYIYFTTLCSQKEIKSDEVSKSTRGIIETGELRARGLIIKGREKRGRTYEVKQPAERLEELKHKFQREWPKEQLSLFGEQDYVTLPKDFLFVDCVHLLLGLAAAGENLLPWLERFRGLRPQLRAGCEYLASRNKAFEKPAKTVLGLLDERVLLNSPPGPLS